MSSSHAAPASAAALSAASPANSAGKALTVGLIGLGLTGIAAFFSPQDVAASYLVGITYCTAITIGMFMLIMIHHIVDASWSVVIRRQFEHGTKAFLWLAVLFLPLVLASLLRDKHDLIWPWMEPTHVVHGGHEVAHDPLYVKKSGFLSITGFMIGTFGTLFLMWAVSSQLRKNSNSQDLDGDPKWTFKNRKTSAYGLPIGAFGLTAIAIFWVKSLEYHWYSTMYGVWFFANCVRGALAVGVIIMVWLWNRGDYKGILNKNHFYSIGMLSFAFTVFWAYVTFSQYFLIWNANIPEETFWYNLRELNHDGSTNQWWYIGLVILFGHFFFPFLFLLSYKFKIKHGPIKFISWWILAIILIDLCYNILPALKDEHGDSLPFFSIRLLWVLTSVIGVGGVCVWSYLKSFPTAKLIPIRDPRIVESLTYHE